jgi:hypothetical protein
MTLDSPRRKRKQGNATNSDDIGSGIACIAQPPTIIGFRCGLTQGRIICVDLQNWFPENLADLAELAKWRIRSEPLPDDTVLDWYDHARDIANAILSMFGELMCWTKENDLGMFRYTSAAQSMAAFRHAFMLHKIYLHDNLACKKHERSGYYGGRTECYYVGKFDFDVWQLDVQSMYPSIMRAEPVPVKLIEYVQTDSYTRPGTSLDYANCIAAVTINTTEPIYPLRRNGGTIYPTGAFRTVLAGAELFRAYRSGHIIGVASCTVRNGSSTDFAIRSGNAAEYGWNDLTMPLRKLLKACNKWAQQSENGSVDDRGTLPVVNMGTALHGP